MSFALSDERKLNECLCGVMSEFRFESWANTELAFALSEFLL